MTTVLGFCGTQRGCTEAQLVTLARFFDQVVLPVELHHGDCIGADDEAHKLALERGWRIVVHPPTDQRKACGHVGDLRLSPKPFLDRDTDIANAGHLLVACPGEVDEVLRSGTWATIRRGRKRGVAIVRVDPTGYFSVEPARSA